MTVGGWSLGVAALRPPMFRVLGEFRGSSPPAHSLQFARAHNPDPRRLDQGLAQLTRSSMPAGERLRKMLLEFQRDLMVISLPGSRFFRAWRRQSPGVIPKHFLKVRLKKLTFG